MAISREMIIQTAKLSKLQIDESEFDHFEEQLDRIVAMVEQLDSLDKLEVDSVKGTYQGIDLVNVMREDIPVNKTDREALLKNTKTHQDGFIKVPAMINDGEEGA